MFEKEGRGLVIMFRMFVILTDRPSNEKNHSPRPLLLLFCKNHFGAKPFEMTLGKPPYQDGGTYDYRGWGIVIYKVGVSALLRTFYEKNTEYPGQCRE